MCWGDIAEGVRVEVFNSDTNLSTKVYWVAEIVKLAGTVDFSLYFSIYIFFNGLL